MKNIASTRGFSSLRRIADCIHANDVSEDGRPSVYVGREDQWGMWVDADGRVDIDSTMPGTAPASVESAARRFAARFFA